MRDRPQGCSAPRGREGCEMRDISVVAQLAIGCTPARGKCVTLLMAQTRAGGEAPGAELNPGACRDRKALPRDAAVHTTTTPDGDA